MSDLWYPLCVCVCVCVWLTALKYFCVLSGQPFLSLSRSNDHFSFHSPELLGALGTDVGCVALLVYYDYVCCMVCCIDGVSLNWGRERRHLIY